MKILKFHLFQESANYRILGHYDTRYSYDLPPFSTVIGMVHSICDFDSYHPMAVGIKGGFGGKTLDFGTSYSFSAGLYDKSRPYFDVVDSEGTNKKGEPAKTGIIRGTYQTELLWDIHLDIYICPENQDEIGFIEQKLNYPTEFPSLGRREDLALISNIQILNFNEVVLNDSLIYPAGWVPGQLGLGTIQYITKDYHLETPQKDKTIRVFNKVAATVIKEETKIPIGTSIFSNREENIFLF